MHLPLFPKFFPVLVNLNSVFPDQFGNQITEITFQLIRVVRFGCLPYATQTRCFPTPFLSLDDEVIRSLSQILKPLKLTQVVVVPDLIQAGPIQ